MMLAVDNLVVELLVETHQRHGVGHQRLGGRARGWQRGRKQGHDIEATVRLIELKRIKVRNG